MRSRTRLRYRGLYAGSASWSPASLSGLAGWYTAGPTWCFTDSGGTTPAGDGDSVYVWKDRSGNARDVSQATSGKRPTLRLVSGRWWVRFVRASSQELTRGTAWVSGVDNWSILYAALTADATPNQQMIAHNGTGGDNNGFAAAIVTNGGNVGGLYPGVAWVNPASINAPTSNVALRSTLARTSGTTRLYRAGAAVTLSGASVTAAPNSPGAGSWIGSRASTDYLGGDVGEVIVTGSALSDADRALAEAYLAAAWGTP